MPARPGPVGALAAVLALSVLLTGCSIPRGSSPEPAATPTEEARNVAAPLVAGMSLDQAREFAARSGLALDPRDASAADREIEFDEQWVVLEQLETPGDVLSTAEPLGVRVLQRGEYPQDTLPLSAEEVLERQRPVMIDLVGMNLSDAYDAADSVGLRVFDAADASPDDRSVFLRSNWTVVGQDVPAGTMGGHLVEVTVLKHGEVTEDSSSPTVTHEGTTTFLGTVTGYEDATMYYSPHQDYEVHVDGRPIVLDLISPYAAACLDDADLERAVEERNRMLPVGSEVLVVLSDPGYRDDVGFVHLVSDVDPRDAFVGSANERLVASGYWVPDHWTFNDDAVAQGRATDYVAVWQESLTPVQAGYAARILATGSAVRASPVGGIVECAEQLAAYTAHMEQMRIEIAEAIARAEAEYERRRAAGYYWCRDGDGDGVCFER